MGFQLNTLVLKYRADRLKGNTELLSDDTYTLGDIDAVMECVKYNDSETLNDMDECDKPSFVSNESVVNEFISKNPNTKNILIYFNYYSGDIIEIKDIDVLELELMDNLVEGLNNCICNEDLTELLDNLDLCIEDIKEFI